MEERTTITRKDFQELNNSILNSFPDRIHIMNGNWIPDALRQRLKTYLSDSDIEISIKVCVDSSLEIIRAGLHLAEAMADVLRSKHLPQELRFKIQEALAEAGIGSSILERVGIKEK